MIEPAEQQQSTVPRARPDETPAVKPLSTRRRTIGLHLLVLAGFTLLTIVATWPALPQLGGYVIDKGNPLYSVWAMAWQAHALVTDPSRLFDTNIMHPFMGTLAFDELSFTEAIMAAPFYFLTGNPLFSHNLVLLAAFVIAGYGMWLLVRHLTGNGWAGFVAGTVLAFSFYSLIHLPHMTLISMEGIPFLLLAAYRLLETRAWRWALAVGALFTVQALAGHYLAYYTALLMLLFFGYYFLFQRGAFSWGLVGKLAVAMLASALVMLPIIVPYVVIQGGQGFSRDLFETERFSNTLASFLAVYRGNPVLQNLLAPFRDPGPWAIDRSAYPGLFTVLLALVGLFGWARRKTKPNEAPASTSISSRIIEPVPLRRHAFFYAIIVVISVVLSLGPYLQITYAANDYDPNAVQRIIPLPYLLLYDWIPGFQSMRVTTRIGVLTTLALAVLAGFGAYYLWNWLSARWRPSVARWALPLVAVVLALLPVLESWSAPIDMQAVGTRSAVPPVYRWLSEQPHTTILEYPAVYYKPGDPNVEMQNLYEYYSVYHWDETINASTSIHPYAYSAFLLETTDCFPCPRSLDVMRMLDVTYVVVHLGNLSGPQRTDFDWRSTNSAGKVVDDFVQVADFGADRVYSLKPRPITDLPSVLEPGSSVLLGAPLDDPIIQGQPDARVAGGYMAALAYLLRDHPQYGDEGLSVGQKIHPIDPANRPDYAILWAKDDPARYGYDAGNRVWSNEFVTMYRRGSNTAGLVGHTGTP